MLCLLPHRRRTNQLDDLEGDSSEDNRSRWARMLMPDLRRTVPNLEGVLRYYASVFDGIGSLERGLGAAMRVFTEHLGPLDPSGKSLEDLLTLT